MPRVCLKQDPSNRRVYYSFTERGSESSILLTHKRLKKRGQCHILLHLDVTGAYDCIIVGIFSAIKQEIQHSEQSKAVSKEAEYNNIV